MNINRNFDSDMWLTNEDMKLEAYLTRKYRNFVPAPGSWASMIQPDPFMVSGVNVEPF